MKIEKAAEPFQPVSLTLQTEAEVRFFRDVLGKTGPCDKSYGLDSQSVYAAFIELNAICHKRKIEPVSNVTITIETKE